MKYHEPVLLAETLDFLKVENGKRYIDCTLGDGGHSIEILKRGGLVLGLDYNLDSLETALERIKSLDLDKNFVGAQGNFKDIDFLAAQNGFFQVDGVLLDLGYSTSQLENKSLGLSFLSDAPLDMRLDGSQDVKAEDLIALLSEKQLENLFWEYGEERKAKEFAKAIVVARNSKKITSTKELSKVLIEAVPLGYDHGRLNPATRVFQALRIVVNNELENLKIALPKAAHQLKLPGGRMLVISFHSLEDRIVKEFGRGVPPEEFEGYRFEALSRGPITPSKDEIKKNRRSRSAKMRVFEIKKDEF